MFAPLFASAEEGVTESSLLLGQTVGVTGQIAGPVREMMAGANAYFAKVNAAGGIYGRKIEVRTLDDQFDPALTAKNADKLIRQEHVFALFQSRGTPHTQMLLPLLAEYKIPLIAPSTGAAVFHHPVNHYVFNVRATYQAEVRKAVEQFSTIGLKEIAILHVDDSFGQDGLEGFRTAMEMKGLKPSAIVSYDRTKPDVRAAVQAVQASQAKALILVASAGPAAELIKGLRAAGSGVQIMTLSNNASQSFIDSLGKDAPGIMVSQIMPAPHLLSTILGQEFKLLAKEYKVPESYAAMEGFVSAKVMVEGLRRAGKNLTRDGLIRALEGVKRHDFGGLTVDYSEKDHSGSEFVELTLIGRDKHFIR
ncbi:ABC transporter substrate-binding protein [Undibacterium oligocarboniphilum]|uniref:ABC transporter substrate-binding protein n=2 Tax=Undibacterium oligocarboniphilum TaxID=666702 RepID=A0A850QLH2_9BURK|nr:ABC transporter substrate-binding protein [Undibacterium oligocarboniphilum]NVO77570.1 ABC transporter substrate-binding protein [Undibacterium oligocarboniphilum]